MLDKEEEKFLKIEKIKDLMIILSKKNNLSLTDNYENVAKAKYMIFSRNKKSPIFCPCESNDEKRFCISEKCLQDIEKNGICHCGCYRKK